MICEDYIERLLAAHADDELIGRDRRAADDHVGACPPCRIRLRDARLIKAAIGRSDKIVRTPADVRLRIRAALGETADQLERAASRSRDAGARGRAEVARLRKVRFALPVAAAAAIALVILFSGAPRGIHHQVIVPPTPIFDLATSQFDQLSQTFEPNVATAAASHNDGAYYAWVVNRTSDDPAEEEAADLARAYREINVPEEIYDFGAAGYGLYGGRIDELPNGKPVTYTLYRGEKGDILSLCVRAPDFSAPIGARYWAGTHTFYEYKGHSISLTFHPDGHYVSILVSREPLQNLLRDVTLAAAVSSVS